MIEIKTLEVCGFMPAIIGMRNAMNSWTKIDSSYTFPDGEFVLGPEDKKLMMKLRNAGTDHRKFMRMITVYADITAPLYWWKEYDTYKVGTVTNSCSTMHKIHSKEFVLNDFSHEHLADDRGECWKENIMDGPYDDYTPLDMLRLIIGALNRYRERYLETKDKKYWWQMIQLLPSSYNQKRTVMMNYEVLANIYKSRKAHKLDEWHSFCDWIETLPYSELITGGEDGNIKDS